MKFCVLTGSPRKNGNTAALLRPFAEELTRRRAAVETVDLYGKKIAPCTACRACQSDRTVFGCAQRDDVQDLSDKILACDCLVLATPIYSWYCTPPMKALLDRLVYGMNKYYGGGEKGPSLWSGKPLALLATCGYRPERGADLWEEGIRRYCKHSGLRCLGMLAERHLGYEVPFMTEEKEAHAREFAESVWRAAQARGSEMS
ncbi:MAG: flavodoxin family protein [Synergistaceae bacterium]|nr:flavodoxin family protein [Synergistaceae bacterium]